MKQRLLLIMVFSVAITLTVSAFANQINISFNADATVSQTESASGEDPTDERLFIPISQTFSSKSANDLKYVRSDTDLAGSTVNVYQYDENTEYFFNSSGVLVEIRATDSLGNMSDYAVAIKNGLANPISKDKAIVISKKIVEEAFQEDINKYSESEVTTLPGTSGFSVTLFEKIGNGELLKNYGYEIIVNPDGTLSRCVKYSPNVLYENFDESLLNGINIESLNSYAFDELTERFGNGVVSCEGSHVALRYRDDSYCLKFNVEVEAVLDTVPVGEDVVQTNMSFTAGESYTFGVVMYYPLEG